MKNPNITSVNLLLILIIFCSFAFFSFKDNSKRTIVNERVFKRTDGVLYQKGKINLKFRNQISSFDSKSFGIEQLDNFIVSAEISNVKQIFPLKSDPTKRIIGDDDLAKIFSLNYDGSIDPFELSEQMMQEYSNILEWAEPDFVYETDYIPNDPSINNQYHIAKVNALQAWDITKGDTSVVIGIVDSGSDLDHPDLQANIKINYAELPINGIDDDANGYIDDWKGWDFIGNGSGQDNDPQVFGSNCDHGSHVSGCASQVTDNGVHGAGVGFRVKLLISKHGDDDDFSAPGGLSYVYNTNEGLVYCYQNGAKVINCSFGSSQFSSFTQNIVANAWNAGSVICASAGNSGLNEVRYPAAYENVISVASTDANDVKSGFSTYHTTVDVSAPGSAILSTLWNNSYATYQGTSMSSPITAGAVALIKSRYPTWTNQQVVDRLVLATDSIYGISGNQSYVGLLGSGRVNAFKSVSDKPIVSLLSYSVTDSLYGNNDGVLEIGERIPIKMNYKNIWLSGNDVSLRLTTNDPNVEIIKDSIYVGNLTAYNSYTTNYNNTFEVKAIAGCPFDKTVIFTLVTSNNAYPNNNSNTITIKFREGFALHNVNNLKLSLTKDGAIGKKTQLYGSGLKIEGNTAANHILEGGLMIGINNTQVSDACRRGANPTNVSDTDFVALKTYSMVTPGQSSAQDGNGQFNDEGAGSTKIGLDVIADSYAFTGAGEQDYIILKYKIKNTSGANLTNLYAGIFMFYQPNGISTSSFSSSDAVNKIGYTYNSATTNPYLGVSLLTDQNFNVKTMNGSEVISGGFTAQEKWTALSSGLSGGQLGPGLNCFTISAGPLNINAGESETVGFAIVKGSDLAGLMTNNTSAKAKYQTVNVNQLSSIVPVKYELSQNYPNPFNPSTKINFSVPKNNFVSLVVYDVLGKEVQTLVNEKLDAGSYDVSFNGANLSSGMYFYRIDAREFIETKRMMLVK